MLYTVSNDIVVDITTRRCSFNPSIFRVISECKMVLLEDSSKIEIELLGPLTPRKDKLNKCRVN